MKRLGRMLLCAALAALLCVPSAMAEGNAEAELRAKLDSACGGGETEEFYCGDYDGDGASEAFAFVGASDEFGYKGDLWYVSAAGAHRLMSDTSFIYFDLRGATPAMAFLAEEGNGGSWSRSHIWDVSGGEPEVIGYTEDNGATNVEFYKDVAANDARTNGTGQTRKPYYFFWKDGATGEYGGIYISEDELYEYRFAREMVQQVLDEGYRITNIIYRANRVVHVNFTDGTHNRYITMRCTSWMGASDWGGGEGVYELASDPSIAIYPAEFVHPTGAGRAPSGGNETPAPSLEDAFICNYDLDGDGAQETLALRQRKGTAEGYDTLEVTLDVIGADGALIASGCIFSHYAVEAAQAAGQSIELKLYALGENRIYTEGTSNFGDAATTAYRLVEPEGGALATRVELRDPGYSDGYGLEKGLYGDVVFESWDYETGVAVLVDPLEEAFAPYALRFAPVEGRVRAQLDGQQLICSVNALELPRAGEAAQTGAMSGEAPGGAEDGAEVGSETFGPAYTTGDVNLREGPGLDYGTVTMAPSGSELEYLGEESVDERGVTWYRVCFNGVEGWGSSKYVSLG